MRDFANQKNLLSESAAGQRQRPMNKSQHEVGAPRRYGRWILLAIIVLVVVIVVVVKHTSAHQQQSSATAQNTANKAQSTPAADAAKKPTATKPKAQGPSKPVFDFYTVLPQQKAQPQATQQQDDQAQPAANQTNKQFMLQVASYQSEQLAQQLRSQLILLGLKPTIASTSSGWYRIEVGPYDSMRAADKVRHQLQSNGINGAMVRQVSDNAGG